MRITPTAEKYEARLAEMRSSSAATIHRRKDQERKGFSRRGTYGSELEDNAKLVCVTSGHTFLGRAIVERLLLHGYFVRIIVDNSADLPSVMEEMRNETESFHGRIEAVTAKLTEVESLVEAFDGCNGVFHTTGFIDPAGVSGYSYMAEVEAKVGETMMEACIRTQSVTKCVMTSSLLACLWQNGTQSEFPFVIDHSCWSDESICEDNKLWYALGKLKAEKNAWRISKANGLTFSTICPAFIINGPDSLEPIPTGSSVAYLKGAHEMYERGLLATVEVNSVAKAHVLVYEAMNKKTTSGRYICFDKVITTEKDVEDLSKRTRLNIEKIRGDKMYVDSTTPFRLSDRRLHSLLSRSTVGCLDEVQLA